MSKTNAKSMNVALLGLFTAIVIVLQFMSYFLKIGTFNLSLVLIPIILAAVLYGPKYSSFLGGVFGVIVVIGCITGMDAGGNMLFSSSPILTTLVCMVKGIAAGYVSGLLAKFIKPKNLYLSVIVAAVAAPVVNTGLFALAMLFIFRDTLTIWAGGTDILYYVIFSLIGINFVIEFLINTIFAPVVLRIVKAIKK